MRERERVEVGQAWIFADGGPTRLVVVVETRDYGPGPGHAWDGLGRHASVFVADGPEDDYYRVGEVTTYSEDFLRQHFKRLT